MNRPRVSVVIPAYNCERYIAESLDSVLAQTAPPFEVIVVDDGSTDGTAARLESYKSRITCIRQQNRGEPAARNRGISCATGEFIAFLDGDDRWLPEKLELQMEYFAAHPACDLVYTDMMTFDDSGVIAPSVREQFGIRFPSGRIFRQLFKETLFGSGSVVCRKACFDKVGPFREELLIGSDYEMWLRIARHSEMGHVDKPLLMYRQHSGMSTRNAAIVLCGAKSWEVAALEAILRSYPESVAELGKRMVNRRLAKPSAEIGRVYLERHEYATARRLAAQAISYWPANFHYWRLYLLTFTRPSWRVLEGLGRRRDATKQNVKRADARQQG